MKDKANISFGIMIMTIGYSFLLQGAPEAAAFILLFAIGAIIVIYTSVSRLLAE